MKKIIGDKYKLNTNHQIGLLITVIILVILIIVFFYAQNHWIVINGQFGDLLAGTIGVGASLGAMIFVIINLGEQRKMNKQIEVHHLVENFNSVLDRLTHLFKSNSEVKTGLTIKLHLSDIWFEIQIELNTVSYKLRERTRASLIKLQEFTNDEDLIKVSRTMNRLLSIKNKISDLDKEAVKRVDDDWKSISSMWKEYAGFYFGWLSIKMEISDNEMIDYFASQNNMKLPGFIPQIEIIKPEDIFRLTLDNFSKQYLTIESKNSYDIEISNIKLSGYSALTPELSINIEKIILPPNSSSLIKFERLFGSNLQTVYDHLNRAPFYDETEKRKMLNQELTINYRGKKWTYENQIELNIYPNNHASVIYQEIPETTEL